MYILPNQTLCWPSKLDRKNSSKYATTFYFIILAISSQKKKKIYIYISKPETKVKIVVMI